MVARRITAGMLIATLTVCPIACWGEAGAAPATDMCCCPCGSPDDEGDPDERPRDEQGGDCLCHGAVIGHHTSAPELLAMPVFWGLPAPTISAACALSAIDAPAERHACHFATADSGRELRALIASFLL